MERVGTRGVAAAALALLLAASAAAAQVGSPAGAVPVDVLEARREAVLERLGDGTMVVGSEEPRELEGEYPQASDFRQDNYFFYLTGLETPGGWLVLRGGGPPGVVLYLPARNEASERWTGPTVGPGEEATARSGIPDVRPAERFPGELPEWSTAGGPPTGSAPLFLSAGAEEHREVTGELARRRGGEAREAREILDLLRLRKDAEELRRLRRAAEITAAGQLEGLRVAAPGVHEYEVEAAIEYVFRREGAERVGFPSIVGSGPNSVVLHYDESRRRMEEGDLVVVDVGAEFGYYTADVTRTYPVSGRFTPRQRRLYGLVLAAQEAALGALRPGTTIGELTTAARRALDGGSGDLCGNRSCSTYFIHGLSHWLGMDVHDVGPYRVPLEPGMVLTLEPGIYLPEEEMGIRIEDDVLVTGEGYELLSRGLPRTADEVEATMREEPRRIRR